MSILDIFWILFALFIIQPIFKLKLLEVSRQKMISRIEQQNNSRVILLVHRQEKMNLLGLPIFSFIDINDSEKVLRAIHLTSPETPLDIILHTPGGLALASLQIARALNKHSGKVTVHIPHYAMSGGTLISLAADEIVMSEHAVLGPVDPVIGSFSGASLMKVVKEKPISKISDQTLMMADQAEKMKNQLQKNIIDLLSDHMTWEQGQELATILTEGKWTHDYAITFNDAKELGLPVNSNISELVLQLMSLYPQPTHQFPSVEFIPGSKRARR